MAPAQRSERRAWEIARGRRRGDLEKKRNKRSFLRGGASFFGISGPTSNAIWKTPRQEDKTITEMDGDAQDGEAVRYFRFEEDFLVVKIESALFFDVFRDAR